MKPESGTGDARQARRIDGGRLAEFIYGTVTGTVAVVGICAGV